MKTRQVLISVTVILLLLCSGNGFAGNKVVNIATEPAWTPYWNKDFDSGGFFVEITAEAFKRVGYDIKMNWVPWKRAQELSFSGKYDALLGCYHTDERAKKLEYSAPVTTAEVVLFELAGRNIKFSNLRDLSPYTIGVIRGYANTVAFDTADYLKKVEAVDSIISIRMLLGGRTDLIINSRKVIEHLINTEFNSEKDNVSVVMPVLQSSNVHIGFSKANPNHVEIKNAFNKGLDEIKKDGTYDRIMKKHGF